MWKNNKRLILLTSFITLLPMLAGLILWNKLPLQMPIHWNAAGEIDGYGTRLFAVVATPLVLLAAQGIFVLMSGRIAKEKKQNSKVMNLVLWIIPALSVFVSTMMYSAALGVDVHVAEWGFVLLGILLMALGNYLPKCTQNRFVGIRTRSTLKSEENWKATHRFGGKVWLASGFGVLLLGVLPFLWAKLAAMAVMFLAVLSPMAYSYVYSKKNPLS